MEIDYCGFMTKKGGNVRIYLRRWFELRGNFLFYFVNQTTEGVPIPPRGFLNLKGAEIDTRSVRKLKIRIISKLLPRVYELKAESVSEFEKWVRKLRYAANYRPEKDTETLRQIRQDIQTVREVKTLFSRDEPELNVPDTPKKKTSLDDFELLCVLGRGTFGKVMKVRHNETGNIYAMKAIKKARVIEGNMVESTKNEQTILKNIKHPYIVGLHYAFQTYDTLYLVLDFLVGGELFFHLQGDERFAIDKARFYAAEIFLALEHLHKNDIIYRDLKPENIVLNAQGHAILTDFGLSKIQIPDNVQTYTFCGTPEYLAPEILKGQGHGKPVDFWSFGILLYTLLVGHAPFYSDNVQVMYQLIMHSGVVKYPPYIPEDARSFINGLLDRDQETRFGPEQIRKHPFFAVYDWDKMERGEITPPFIPQIKNESEDTKYFYREFTSEDFRNESVCEPFNPAEADFGSFTYEQPIRKAEEESW
jgi:serine/threonine protein kinase